MERTYICIDLKSYYASVECVHRGLDPLKANLLVADESRSDQTICLAVSPALKAMGVPGRPRLFEAKQKIRDYENRKHTKVDYIVAVPRMAEYERISAQIYSIYLRYVAPEDIHVYSIDECFIDCTYYLSNYQKEADKLNTNLHPRPGRRDAPQHFHGHCARRIQVDLAESEALHRQTDGTRRICGQQCPVWLPPPGEEARCL